MTGKRIRRGIVLRDPTGRVCRDPDQKSVEAAIGRLARDTYVVLSSDDATDAGSSGHYAQVWLRPNGIYQVEYREGDSSTHLRGLTASPEKAAAFLVGWQSQDPHFGAGFQWDSIASWFQPRE